MLDAKRNNFLAAIYAGPSRGSGSTSGGYGFAVCRPDRPATSDSTELADEKELADELARVQPAEVLVTE